MIAMRSAVSNTRQCYALRRTADDAVSGRLTRHLNGGRIFFSAAPTGAASLAYDEDDEINARFVPSNLSRPRLQRLRQQLQDESIAGVSSSPVRLSRWASEKSPSPALPPPAPRPPPPQSDLVGTADCNKSSDLEELKAWISQLPDVDKNRVLTDSHRRRHTYLRLSLTERCNLRCTYCMPPEGVPLQPDARLLRTDELLHLCRVFSSLGVTKFRLTGGEPTLRKDLPDVVAGIKSLDPDLIGMTSNGIKIPTLLPDLVDAGLDSLNLSLDTLRPERFAQMTRRPAANLRRVLQALEMAHDDYAAPSYLAPARRRRPFTVKLNCVVMRGLNDDEVHDFVRLVDRYPHLQVRFIEYMPFDANGWQTSLLVPYRELLDSLKGVGLGLRPEPSDDPSDTTKWFSLEPPRGGEGAKMRRQVGFITSMSSHFCDSCNRLRLTADGQLKSCLFDGGEISLRDVLRRSGGSNGWSMRDLCKLIYYGSVLPKKRALGGHESPQDIQDGAKRNRPMTLIGG